MTRRIGGAYGPGWVTPMPGMQPSPAQSAAGLVFGCVYHHILSRAPQKGCAFLPPAGFSPCRLRGVAGVVPFCAGERTAPALDDMQAGRRACQEWIE